MNSEIKNICYAVDDLKRRNLFVSLLVTNNGRVQISYWYDGRTADGRKESGIRTGDLNGVRMYLRALEENERREMEWLAKRLGRGPSRMRDTKRAKCAVRFGM